MRIIGLNKDVVSDTIHFTIKVADRNSGSSWTEDYDYTIGELIKGFSKNLVNEFNETEKLRFPDSPNLRDFNGIVISGKVWE